MGAHPAGSIIVRSISLNYSLFYYLSLGPLADLAAAILLASESSAEARPELTGDIYR